MFTHRAPWVHKNSFEMPVHSRIELEFGNVGFWGEGKTKVPGGKTSQSRVDNQQQTQPTYDAGSRNGTRDTLAVGKHSHHCAIPVPWYFIKFILKSLSG